MSAPHTLSSSAPSANRATPAEIAQKGWASKLAACTTAFLLVEAVTGLWLYLGGFSLTAQIMVLLHTGLGIVMSVLYTYYQVRHLQAWYKQKATVMMVLGYALMAAILTCIFSGFVLTYQGLFGPKISATYDLVHLVSGVAALALLVFHVAFALRRRLAVIRKTPPFALAVRQFFRRSGVLIGTSAVGVLVLVISFGSKTLTFEVPSDYTIPEYLADFEEYRDSPFAPTNARTEGNVLIDSSALSGSASCGTSGCHEQILAEWQPSAHRFSANNPPFQAVQKNFAADRDATQTRYCAGCHDPISLFAGAKDIHNMDLAAPGMQEGASCAACHSISQVDVRGNADYVLTAPQKYLWEDTAGWKKSVSDFLIRAYPRQHLADYDRNVLRSAEYCGACHKQFIPEALNRFGRSGGQNQFDEWSKSHWHTEDNPDTNLSCRDCHMRLVYDSDDPGRGEGGDLRRSLDDNAHRHHGFIATNFLMPQVMKLPHWEKQVALTEEWIRGETVIPEIAHLWPEGPVAQISMEVPDNAALGDAIDIKVLVKNSKVGHNFTTGPLDFMRAWVHLTIEDADGTVVAEWGSINPTTRWLEDRPGVPHVPGNSVKDGTLVLEAVPLDAEGQALTRHDLWKKAGGENSRVIFPKYSDQQMYSFAIPQDTKGPLTVKAELNFRRYRQEFLDTVVPEMEEEAGFYQPTVTHDTAIKHIVLRGKGEGEATGSAKEAGK